MWDEDGLAAAAEAALDDFPGDETEESFVRWLREEAGPDDRHRTADGWNWDQGEDVLLWIVTRPDCDRATALLVFWRGQPAHYLDTPEPDRAPLWPGEGEEVLEAIRRRWRAGRYARAELAYDPAADGHAPDYKALRQQHGPRLAEKIPPGLRRALPGRVPVGEPLIDGIPQRFWPEESR